MFAESDARWWGEALLRITVAVASGATAIFLLAGAAASSTSDAAAPALASTTVTSID